MKALKKFSILSPKVAPVRPNIHPLGFDSSDWRRFRSRLAVRLGTLLVAAALQVPAPGVRAADSTSDRARAQSEAYVTLIRADRARDEAQADEARTYYREALEQYRSLARQYPGWHDDIFQYRITYCANQLKSLEQATDEPAGGQNAPQATEVPENLVALTEQNQALSRENGYLRSRLDEIEEELDQQQASQTAPVDDEALAQLRAEKESLQREVERLGAANSEPAGKREKRLKAKVKALEEKLGDANKLAKSAKRKGDELARAQSQIAEQAAKLDDLEKEYKALLKSSQDDSAEREAARLGKRVAEVEKALAKERESAARLEARWLSKVRQAEADGNAKREDAANRTKEAEARVVELEQQLKGARAAAEAGAAQEGAARKLANLETEFDTLTKEYGRSQAAAEKQADEVARLRKQLEKEQERSTASDSGKTAKVEAKWAKKLEVLERDLRDQWAVDVKRADQAEQQVAEQQQAVEQLKKDLRGLADELKVAKRGESDTARGMEDERKEAAQTKTALDREQKHVTELLANQEQLQTENADLRERLSSADQAAQQVAEQQQAVEQLKRELRAAQETSAAQERELQGLADELKAAKRGESDTARGMEAERKEAAQTKTALDREQKHVTELLANQEQLQTENADLRERLSSADQERAQAARAQTKLRAEIERLQAQAVEQGEALSATKDALDQAVAARKQAEKTVRAVRARRDEVEWARRKAERDHEELVTLRHDRLALLQDIDALERELKASATLSQRLEQLQQDLREKDEELRRLR